MCNDVPNFSIGQITSHLSEAFAKTAAIGHAKRPAEFDLLNVALDALSVLQDPLPDGLVPLAC